eukprot:c8976_g1_i1 orf=79-243(+)
MQTVEVPAASGVVSPLEGNHDLLPSLLFFIVADRFDSPPTSRWCMQVRIFPRSL